ncbi:MAG TPA: hypothetical protein VFI84_00855 [Candidatus Saccharimonadales bacterium]|nr:hypothetical protein [Candidatus Saccharimonadales bacterium]
MSEFYTSIQSDGGVISNDYERVLRVLSMASNTRVTKVHVQSPQDNYVEIRDIVPEYGYQLTDGRTVSSQEARELGLLAL